MLKITVTEYIRHVHPGAVVIPCLLALLVLLIYVKIKWDQTAKPKVVAKKFMTPNEIEFMGRLRRALPGLEVLPQVSMGALLDLNLSPNHPEYWAIRSTFSQKIVDFVVCAGPKWSIVAVVELDDRTHDSKTDKDLKRDRLLLSAGIKTVRWDSRKKPSTTQISDKFKEICHSC
jgi:hypothetical protein